jgi:hypothetical protein
MLGEGGGDSLARHLKGRSLCGADGLTSSQFIASSRDFYIQNSIPAFLDIPPCTDVCPRDNLPCRDGQARRVAFYFVFCFVSRLCWLLWMYWFSCTDYNMQKKKSVSSIIINDQRESTTKKVRIWKFLFRSWIKKINKNQIKTNGAEIRSRFFCFLSPRPSCCTYFGGYWWAISFGVVRPSSTHSVSYFTSSIALAGKQQKKRRRRRRPWISLRRLMADDGPSWFINYWPQPPVIYYSDPLRNWL